MNLRADFPILNLKNEAGQALIYLDNAATTQKPTAVINALQHFYTHQNANIHRGIYDLADQATQLYENTRLKVQKFIQAAHQESIIFTSGTTSAVNLVAHSFLKNRLNTGDEVIITSMEHHSNLIPWQMACQQKGAVLKVIPINQKGEIIFEKFEQMLSEKTKMIAVVHISNTLGTINPIQKIIAKAKGFNVPVFVDAAQSILSEAINVQELDCDFLVFSGHKMFGPTGVGVLYGKKNLLEEMKPYQYGGDMIRSVSFEETTFAKLPARLEAGTPNVAGVIGLGAAIDYINIIGKKTIKNQLNLLTEYATEKLSAISYLRIIGQAEQKSGIISFVMENIHPHDIATFLNEDHIAIRAGHHCTQPLMRWYEVPATARVSFGVYNTKEEVDVLVGSLGKMVEFFG